MQPSFGVLSHQRLWFGYENELISVVMEFVIKEVALTCGTASEEKMCMNVCGD